MDSSVTLNPQELPLNDQAPAPKRKLKPAAEYKLLKLRETVVGYKADNPEKIFEYWRDNIETSPQFNPDVEHFVVLWLNTQRRVMGHLFTATGTLDTIHVHPREVFKGAIVANAHAIVLTHNHPSGEPNPSEADIKVTRDFIRAGQLLKIEVLDHVIVGNKVSGLDHQINRWVSLRTLGYFYSS